MHSQITGKACNNNILSSGVNFFFLLIYGAYWYIITIKHRYTNTLNMVQYREWWQ